MKTLIIAYQETNEDGEEVSRITHMTPWDLLETTDYPDALVVAAYQDIVSAVATLEAHHDTFAEMSAIFHKRDKKDS